MSHYILELIIPPTNAAQPAIEEVLKPFDENYEDEEGWRNPHSFWDFYVIGGRWSGHHLESSIDKDQKKKFFDELEQRKVTVSGLRMGKQELQPADQIPMVDALWRQYFPESELKVCPFFKHFGDQYAHSCMDIDMLGNVPLDKIKCSRMIIAGPHWNDDSKLEAKWMIEESIWNGCNYQDTGWDGLVSTGLEMQRAYLEMQQRKEDYLKKHIPTDDWLIATIDYHS